MTLAEQELSLKAAVKLTNKRKRVFIYFHLACQLLLACCNGLSALSIALGISTTVYAMGALGPGLVVLSFALLKAADQLAEEIYKMLLIQEDVKRITTRCEALNNKDAHALILLALDVQTNIARQETLDNLQEVAKEKGDFSD